MGERFHITEDGRISLHLDPAESSFLSGMVRCFHPMNVPS
jgi:hypothetical protein